jgi:hypothetical protein
MSADSEKTKDRIIDTIKFWQDTFKHLTTLSSGAIIILATFLDKGRNPPKVSLVAVIFALLIISVISSVAALVWLSLAHMGISVGGGNPHRSLKFASFCEIISVAGFILALVALAIFVVGKF